jgi:hypothetical protein
MTELADPTTNPPDICLLLRVHGEQRWLIATVVALLRQLEEPDGIPEPEVGAALSYLEVLWLEAGLRATQTDAARAQLDAAVAEGASLFVSEKARRYHAAVRRLREAVDRRVRRLTCQHEDQRAQQPASS